VYNKQEILAKIKLNSEAFRVLGVVSGNDYSQNALGYGIKKNMKILQKIQDATTDLLQSYCDFVGCEKR
jgi:hypothetical protein